MKNISIIIPCFQNEGSIPILGERLLALEEKLEGRVRFSFVLVNDGSTDGTLNELIAFKNKANNRTTILKLSRNFGSYNAFLAGMTHSVGDAHVHLHADLQDPPELIEQMIDFYQQGTKLVIAHRTEREDVEDVTFFASLYHFLVKRYAIKNIPKGGFDLMLFDEQIRKEVVAISEKNTNIVYLISWLGYPYVAIPYTRKKRIHGKSQWTFWKNVKLFMDTFFSFSNLPLNILRFVSLLSIALSLVMAGYWAVAGDGNLLSPIRLLGFTGLFVFICLSLSLFILAEYMLRIHETVRKRPNFVVEDVL